MARLIDADALSEHIKGLPTWFEDGGGMWSCLDGYPNGLFYPEDIISSIENAPTVDAVEVVHGRWIPNFEYDFDRGEHRLTGYHCDKCGIWTLKKSNYCPNCGARMDDKSNVPREESNLLFADMEEIIDAN